MDWGKFIIKVQKLKNPAEYIQQINISEVYSSKNGYFLRCVTKWPQYAQQKGL